VGPTVYRAILTNDIPNVVYFGGQSNLLFICDKLPRLSRAMVNCSAFDESVGAAVETVATFLTLPANGSDFYVLSELETDTSNYSFPMVAISLVRMTEINHAE